MFVRQSKFRHVFGKETRQDGCFNGIQFECNGDNGCAVNGKWLAVVNKNKIFVLPCDKPSRFDNNTGYIDTENPKILDVAWNPFNDNQLACSSETPAIKLYTIPEDGIVDLDEAFKDAEVTLDSPHFKKITNIYWHPTAENIMASISHCPMVVIWDLINCTPITQIDDNIYSDTLFGLAWNYNGSKIATVSKDKYLRVICPRSGEVIAEKENCHEGTRGTKVTFTKDGRIITCGSNKKSDRQMKMWDKDDPTKLIFELDLGNASAILQPICDYDLNLIITYGKGEGFLKFYEIGKDEIFYLNTYQSSISQKGGNFIPKRAVNAKAQEIARFYKIHQKDRVEPISLIVPRKNDTRFQHDIFPPCMSGVAALTSDEWISGKDSEPNLIDLSGGASTQTTQRKPVQRKQRQHPVATPAAQGDASAATSYNNGGTSIPAGINFEELLEDMKKVKATVRKLNKRVTALEQQLAEVGAEVDQEEEEEEEEE